MQWSPKSIPRTTFPARRYTQTLDEYNRPSVSFVDFTVENAGAPQPVIGEDQIVLPEGFRNRNTFRIFTTTVMRSVEEFTSNEADQVYIAPFWYTVVKSHPWSYGLQSHYEIYVAKNPDQ